MFENVKGSEPYYLSIPHRDFIFFVTSDERQIQYIYHFVSVKSGQEIRIQVPHTDLGAGIGNEKDAHHYDWIEKTEWPKVVIASRLLSDVKIYEFDLDHQTVVEKRQP